MYEHSETARPAIQEARQILAGGEPVHSVAERYEVIQIDGAYAYALIDNETLEGAYSDDQSVLDRMAKTLNAEHVRKVRRGGWS